MNLEMLLNRAKEIDAAIVNVNNQLNALHGHKAETLHWIEQLKSQSDAAVVELPVDSTEEIAVE